MHNRIKLNRTWSGRWVMDGYEDCYQSNMGPRTNGEGQHDYGNDAVIPVIPVKSVMKWLASDGDGDKDPWVEKSIGRKQSNHWHTAGEGKQSYDDMLGLT